MIESVMNYHELTVNKGLRIRVLAVVFMLGIPHLSQAGETMPSMFASTVLPPAVEQSRIDMRQYIAQADSDTQSSSLKGNVLNPHRRLLRISVHQGPEPPGGAQGRRLFSTRKGRTGATVHVDVLDGEIGTVRIGEAEPIVQGGVLNHLNPSYAYFSTGYVAAVRGFLVMPQIQGDEIILRIASSGNRLSRRGDLSVEIFEADTIVRGPLGEWLSLGGTQNIDAEAQLGTGHSFSTRDSDYPRLWVRAIIPSKPSN